RHPVLRDFSTRAIEPADVTGLAGKPDRACVVDDQRVRAAARGRLVLPDLAGCRIELADGAVAVARVPDLALLVDQQSVRRRAGRESNARPMASEAITLSPELRARERKLYTARRRGLCPVNRGGQMVFDEAHGLLERSGRAQPALDARAQHSVDPKALDHCD